MTKFFKKNNPATFLTHLLLIVILFVLPEVLSSLSRPWKPINIDFFIKAMVYVGVFYIEYYAILNHTAPRRMRWGRFAALNVAMVSVILLGFYLFYTLNVPQKPPKHPDHVRIVSKVVLFLSHDFVMLVLTIALAVAMKFGEQWRELQQRDKELEASQRREELAQLKSQLNPHFLFNTLNSIYALIAISPEKAQTAVHELSAMLRYVLYDSPATVPLQSEMNFVKNYVELMKLRLSPKQPVDLQLDPADGGDLAIAPLLFITLIENVFKHGNTAEPHTPIKISITCHDGIVSCITSNAIAPRNINHDSNEGGIGIANLHRRLHLLYGDRASLKTSVKDGCFTATLTIDLNP